MSAATMQQALDLIRENQPESIEKALALLQSTVYSFSMKVCGHPEDAEDTMQDVLLKLLPYLPKFENSQALSVWLYKVARNRCMMSRRGAKNARHKHVSLDELMPTPEALEYLADRREAGPEGTLLREERDARLRKAIQKIPPDYRMALVLHDMEGLTSGDVARVTGVREGTVRVRLHRGRLILRQELERLSSANQQATKKHRGVSSKKAPARPRHCRELFASLSDYMDGLADEARRRDMDRHLFDCKPCVAFLDSLKSAVAECNSCAPECNSTRAAKLRKELMEKYQLAVAALPKRT